MNKFLRLLLALCCYSSATRLFAGGSGLNVAVVVNQSSTNLVGDTNTALETNLVFSIVASPTNIANIELLSTGGLLTNVFNQSSALFSVPGASLGLGLHPFYAIVTASSGNQFRTETKWIRLLGRDAPMRVGLTATPPRAGRNAAAGRSYDILSSPSLSDTFQVSATMIASNSAAHGLTLTRPQRGAFTVSERRIDANLPRGAQD